MHSLTLNAQVWFLFKPFETTGLSRAPSPLEARITTALAQTSAGLKALESDGQQVRVGTLIEIDDEVAAARIGNLRRDVFDGTGARSLEHQVHTPVGRNDPD